MSPRPTPKRGRSRRISTLVVALVAAAVAGMTAGTISAQGGGGDPITLVNVDRQLVERKKDGRFIARPVFDRKIELLAFGIRHPDTGEWITPFYVVRGGEKRLSDGWEYTFEYPSLDDQPSLDPERIYLLAMSVSATVAGDRQDFHAAIPVHQPTGLWDRVLAAFDPTRWARAIARWIVEGVHGTLCGVVEKVEGGPVSDCRGGRP